MTRRMQLHNILTGPQGFKPHLLSQDTYLNCELDASTPRTAGSKSSSSASYESIGKDFDHKGCASPTSFTNRPHSFTDAPQLCFELPRQQAAPPTLTSMPAASPAASSSPRETTASRRSASPYGSTPQPLDLAPSRRQLCQPLRDLPATAHHRLPCPP
jgi:hypothetical protein